MPKRRSKNNFLKFNFVKYNLVYPEVGLVAWSTKTDVISTCSEQE